MQVRIPTPKNVRMLPATPALPEVAMLPATATLPAVAMLPATATLPAVATLPAMAMLPAVAMLPATPTDAAVALLAATARLSAVPTAADLFNLRFTFAILAPGAAVRNETTRPASAGLLRLSADTRNCPVAAIRSSVVMNTQRGAIATFAYLDAGREAGSQQHLTETIALTNRPSVPTTTRSGETTNCVMSRPHRPDAPASLTTLPTTAPSIDVPMLVTYHKEPLHRLAVRVPIHQHRGVTALAIAVGLVVAWAVGGAIHHDPETADLFYLPILLAAWSFGLPGGVLVGVTAGILIGPLGTTGRDWGDILLGTTIYAFVGALGGLASAILHRRLTAVTALSHRLEQGYLSTLSVMVSALEWRDIDTAGHSARVGGGAKAVGQCYGMSATELSQLYWAGVLHDVGKIAIAETILHKADALSPKERMMVETHAALGADLIVQASEDLAPIAGLVRMHHERWDGNGYPAGLRGARIALGARILKVADVFDALTSARPYRRILSADEAMAYLRSESGTQFDPDVVSTFGDLVTRGIIQPAPGGAHRRFHGMPGSQPR
jgi:hypothetical protein